MKLPGGVLEKCAEFWRACGLPTLKLTKFPNEESLAAVNVLYQPLGRLPNQWPFDMHMLRGRGKNKLSNVLKQPEQQPGQQYQQRQQKQQQWQRQLA